MCIVINESVICERMQTASNVKLRRFYQLRHNNIHFMSGVTVRFHCAM